MHEPALRSDEAALSDLPALLLGNQQ